MVIKCKVILFINVVGNSLYLKHMKSQVLRLQLFLERSYHVCILRD